MANLTNRQVISDIIGDLRAINLDDKVSKRYIHHKLLDYTALLIKRDADARRVVNISDIWLEVQCVEFEQVPLVDCCDVDVPNCTTVARSCKKIPETMETFYKELLEVHNLTYAKEFRQITPKEYKNIKLRPFQDKRIKYFWFSNGHIVIPDCLIESATIRGVFINTAEAKKLSSCYEQSSKCVGILDERFVCPDYLVPAVKQQVLQDLFNFYKRSILDEDPNLDTNDKQDKNPD
jgi:hypothetical protein